ncbi:MAG: ankyrin repeat domain-containing protein, partial [Opitutales bacterium]|nr:ankyrin repeat domain-containing protein [Opitutales bacterium]
GSPVKLQFDARYKDGTYVEVDGRRQPVTRQKLVSLAKEGGFVGTFTARHGENADYDHPQPALWTLGPIHQQRGLQKFPRLSTDNKAMTVSGRHIRDGASLSVNGRKVAGSIRREPNERVVVELASLPPIGMHFLQVQNPSGLFSNDFIFHVTGKQESTNVASGGDKAGRLRIALGEAISNGNLKEIRKLVGLGADVNKRAEDGGTPLSAAAFHGRLEISRFLIKKGARIAHTNRDGNTPLHVAVFLCREEITKLFLDQGASVSKKNNREETPVNVVTAPWSDELAGFYNLLNNNGNLGLDLGDIQKSRPIMAKFLREHAAQSKK